MVVLPCLFRVSFLLSLPGSVPLFCITYACMSAQGRAALPKAALGQTPPASLKFLARLAVLLGFVYYVLEIISSIRKNLLIF